MTGTKSNSKIDWIRNQQAIIIAVISTCICAAGLAFETGPWQLWIGAILLLVCSIAYENIPAAVAVLITIGPFNDAIRWHTDNALILGIRDIFSYIIFFVFYIRYRGRFQLCGHSAIAVFFVIWCVFVQSINMTGFVVGALGLRSLVQFFLLFPVVVIVVSESGVKAASDLLGVIVITAGILSVVQLLNHFGYIKLLLPESEVLIRNFGGGNLPRMIPILKISSSGLAIYMVSASLIVFARLLETGKVPFIWLPCLCGSLACAGLTLSHSGLVALLVGIATLCLCSNKRKLAAIILAGAFFLFLPVLFGNSSFTDKNTSEYSATFFKLWEDNLKLAMANPVFGTGAVPAGYLAEVIEGEQHSNGDGGWAMFACQVGIPMAAIMLGWALGIVGVAIWTLRTNEYLSKRRRWVLAATLVATVVYFVNAHGVPWYRVGADVNFIVLAAILIGLSRPGFFG